MHQREIYRIDLSMCDCAGVIKDKAPGTTNARMVPMTTHLQSPQHIIWEIKRRPHGAHRHERNCRGFSSREDFSLFTTLRAFDATDFGACRKGACAEANRKGNLLEKEELGSGLSSRGVWRIIPELSCRHGWVAAKTLRIGKTGENLRLGKDWP
jgi:hypothetical protein